MVESEKGAVLARYELRAVKKGPRAKGFHRTKALARQEWGKSSQNPPHGIPSAPKRPRIFAREPESTARSLFRARISPRSPHKGHSAPEIQQSATRSLFRAKNPPKPPHGTQRATTATAATRHSSNRSPTRRPPNHCTSPNATAPSTESPHHTGAPARERP